MKCAVCAADEQLVLSAGGWWEEILGEMVCALCAFRYYCFVKWYEGDS